MSLASLQKNPLCLSQSRISPPRSEQKVHTFIYFAQKKTNCNFPNNPRGILRPPPPTTPAPPNTPSPCPPTVNPNSVHSPAAALSLYQLSSSAAAAPLAPLSPHPSLSQCLVPDHPPYVTLSLHAICLPIVVFVLSPAALGNSTKT